MAAFTERAADSLAASMIFDTSPKTARYPSSSTPGVAFLMSRFCALSGISAFRWRWRGRSSQAEYGQRRSGLRHASASVGSSAGRASVGDSLSGVSWPSLVAYLIIRDTRRRSLSSASGPGLEKTLMTPISWGPLSEDKLYPKEKALVDLVAAERMAGRRVLVYATHTGTRDITGRMEDILTRHGFRVAVMKADAVAPDRREAWVADRVKQAST